MTFDKALRLRGISIKEEVAYACRMLESQGFEFGKDFVTASAIDAAGAAILELEHYEPNTANIGTIEGSL